MEKYLISCRSYKDALEISKSMKLKRSEWVWIPFNDMFRQRKLLGRRASNIKYLIGSFTDKEKAYLMHSRVNDALR